MCADVSEPTSTVNSAGVSAFSTEGLYFAAMSFVDRTKPSALISSAKRPNSARNELFGTLSFEPSTFRL